MSMFCRQCEQVAKGVGCTVEGVCGKNPDAAALQDLLVYAVKGLGYWADMARSIGAKDEEIDRFVIDALFATVTNVNFDPDAIAALIARANSLRGKARELYEKQNGAAFSGSLPAAAKPLSPAADRAALIQVAKRGDVKDPHADADIQSMREIILYGVKGFAAYTHHAFILGKESDEIYASMHQMLASLINDKLVLGDYISIAMEVGRINYIAMELLNQANVERFGHPVPTPVSTGTKAGKAILVSGHDLRFLEEVLKQTEGTGVNVYTHCEMLPAHGYPGLKKYAHLAGNFGGAWQDQQKEFPQFPGAIIFNTNCLQKPADSYKDRTFTWGPVHWPGVKHIEGWDFSEVIKKAKECQVFEEKQGQEILVGFGHNAVLGVADKVIEAVKSGAIKRFYVVGGCDGARSGRNYYTELVEKAPRDTVILTLACGKYRFNKLSLGDIGGIPRLLDIGQCNDTYSAVQIALALAGAFNCDVNSLPLSIILSWYEQKAVAVLLTLLHLGITNIKIGPSLPAFITPNVLSFLVEKFKLAPIGTPEKDLAPAG